MADPLPNWDTHDVRSLEVFSKIRLVAVDLDGTLLHGNVSTLGRIQNLRRSLAHHQYKVNLTLATGRTLAGVHQTLGLLSLPKGVPLILYNGSVIIRNGTFHELVKRTISNNSLRKIVELTSEHPVSTLAYFYQTPFFQLDGGNESREYVLGWTTITPVEREFNGMEVRWERSTDVHEDYSPSAIIIDPNGDMMLSKSIESHLSKIDDVSVTKSGSGLLEVRPYGSNKGIALREVASFLGLSKENVLALGDNDNDAEMLAWAGIGVTISNGSTSALDNSDYVCRYGVAKGAVEVLRLVRNSRRYFVRPEGVETIHE
ncbi:MAG: HAD family phosphatase [Nitrospira sp.]